ncbi:MAG TPA: metal/formaldehyde-sensitive transcriptional repressor [Steroidobacteraceae bacterium]|nr:metal/formaldehyde-sensitive transcriptional repressor [Steroidobacteraceae bacterium]
MAHAVRDRQKLLNRIRRIRGQIEAVERTLEGEADCSAVMHLLTASRGAINSLLAEVLEDHVREHLLGRASSGARADAADELIDVIHAYFK